MATKKSYTRKRTTRKRTYSRSTASRKSSGVARKRPYYRRYQKTVIPKALPKFFVAQVNPFKKDAIGCRVPDESTAASSAFHVKDRLSVTVPTANGNMAGAFFYPSSVNFCATGDASSSSAIAWPINYGNTQAVSKRASVQASYSVVRSVAHGIKITCPLNLTTAAGYVHIASYTLNTQGKSTWALPTTVAGIQDLPGYKRVTLQSLTQNPLIVVNKFLDQTAFKYTDPNSDEFAGQTSRGNFHAPMSWQGIMMLCEGHGAAAGTVVLDVENMLHLEGQTLYGAVASDESAEPADAAAFDATCETVGSSGNCFREGTLEEQSHIKQMRDRMKEALYKFGTDLAKAYLKSLVAEFVPGNVPVMPGIPGWTMPQIEGYVNC